MNVLALAYTTVDRLLAVFVYNIIIHFGSRKIRYIGYDQVPNLTLTLTLTLNFKMLLRSYYFDATDCIGCLFITHTKVHTSYLI